jgi:large subunit ribosomal protein L29
MEPREVRDASDEELAVRERELTEALFLLRLRQRSNQLDSPAKVGQTRRDIARIKTVQRERALARKK